MANRPPNQIHRPAARLIEQYRSARGALAGLVAFAAAHPIAALKYQVHWTRRARAVLVASAADVIGRAL
jgi:hypothetical protein